MVYFSLQLGTVHMCATTGANRGCYENELKCPFKKANSACLDEACRLTFTVLSTSGKKSSCVLLATHISSTRI